MADRNPPEQTETHLILDLEPAEDTEKVYPPARPEAPPLPRTVEQRPLNLADILRLHRAELAQLVADAVRSEVGMLRTAMLQGQSPSQPPPPSTARKVASVVAGGALKGVRWGGYVALGLAIAVEVARQWRPGLVGPLETLSQLLTGGQ